MTTDARIVTLETLGEALRGMKPCGDPTCTSKHVGWCDNEVAALLAALPPAPALDVEREKHAVLLTYDRDQAEIARLRRIEEAARRLCFGKSIIAPEWWQAERDLRAALGEEGPITDANGDELENGAPDDAPRCPACGDEEHTGDACWVCPCTGNGAP